jgi:hypothetical protein
MIDDFILSCECEFGNPQDTLDLLNELFDLDYTLEDLDK